MPDAPTDLRRHRGRVGAKTIPTLLAVIALLVLTLAGCVFGPADVALAAPAVGIPEQFWARDWGLKTYESLQAVCRYVGEHVAVYVEDGAVLSEYTVSQLGTDFDSTIYPALTSAYGPEPNPGIDGDGLIAILIYDFNDPSHSLDGSFNPYDIEPQTFPHSNRREMFYLNLEAILAQPYGAGALAAHEFTHLIVHYRDVMLDPSPDPQYEPTWLVEGFTTYGEHLAGYDGRTNGQLLSFTGDPNFSLTFWQGTNASYGASYAFMRYLAERQGPLFVRALVDQPLDGVAGINAVLASMGSSATFGSMFDDWIVANFLDEKRPSLGPYSYSGLNVSASTWVLSGVEPLLGDAAVINYGAVYLDFPAASPESTFQAVVDGSVESSLEAALISWDSAGVATPTVARFDLANAAGGGTVTAPAGHDRHTLAVWARGTVGAPSTAAFRYSGAADPPAGVQFLDMGGSDPFYQYAAVLLARGVINGKEIPPSSGLWFFAGADNVTRAQFAKMIMLATGLHTLEIDNPGDPTFSDVPYIYDGNGYPYDFIEEAADLGIVNGYGNGAFGPGNPITRSQLVLMIIRGATAVGKPLDEYQGSEKKFADVSVSHPYYRQIMTAYTAGILSGSQGADGKWYFRPYSSASRNHVAKMTAKLLEHLDGWAPLGGGL